MPPPLRDTLQHLLGSAYRLERELAGGGMSHVFVAEEVALGRRVVVKVLTPELARGLRAERFRREIQLAATLQHPAIVPLLAADAGGEVLWFSMPLVEGQSLADRIEEGTIPVEDAVRWGRDLLEALEHAHARGVVHRDIKPANILLNGRRAVVTDFGVAKALYASADDETIRTAAGTIVGTPAYMAPEQVRGDGVDARTDLYSAGMVMYEMLAGRGPFRATTSVELMRAHAMEAPRPLPDARPDAPPALAAVVMRLIAKHPDARFASATEAVAALDQVPTGTGIHRALRRPSIVQRLKGLLGG